MTFVISDDAFAAVAAPAGDHPASLLANTVTARFSLLTNTQKSLQSATQQIGQRGGEKKGTRERERERGRNKIDREKKNHF